MERPKKSGAVAGLPDDPLVEILSRVLVKDLHRSKCVSKGWRDLIADPLHRKKLPQTLQGFFPSYPGESFMQYGRPFINLFGGSPPPVDTSLPFLKKLPGIHKIWLRGSCNGLLLFKHHTSLHDLGHIVFNPATEQWAAVPCEHTPMDKHCRLRHTFLVFDPAVSSHFQLVIFCEEGNVCTVHSYSSKTGLWSHTQIDWAEEVKQRGQLKKWVPQISGVDSHATLFNGMLYLMLSDDQIAEVDVEGKTRRIISAPPSVGRQVFATVQFSLVNPKGACIASMKNMSEHEEKLMGCGEASTKDVARVGKCGSR
ncbi:putative F-box protein At3g16210 [Panicum virgatum]|uniref:putative F-box protein At3g16210 n=1 Tax=Panicum virgatum TaxID=38727 RepID=UPI0019D5A9E4|nr:putative F-box protein At3g16210 [Panicum virgatum]